MKLRYTYVFTKEHEETPRHTFTLLERMTCDEAGHLACKLIGIDEYDYSWQVGAYDGEPYRA